jgi:gas vesicle structural protein
MGEDRDLSLLETLDHLLDRGVVITGEATISVADVDLLYLGLSVVLGNIDAVDRLRLPPSLKKNPGGEG